MKVYLEKHALYVKKDDEKLVYKVVSYEPFYNSECIYLHLELVAGWDYINPDENDMQGWCSKDVFVEDIQDETIAQYFIKEGMEECLQENNFEILGKFDDIDDNDIHNFGLKVAIKKSEAME